MFEKMRAQAGTAGRSISRRGRTQWSRLTRIFLLRATQRTPTTALTVATVAAWGLGGFGFDSVHYQAVSCPRAVLTPGRNAVERISVGELKKNFNDVLKLAGNAKHRFVIQDRGKESVGIVPLEDLALLENLDGAKPIAVARLASPEMKRHLSEDLARVASGEQRIIVYDKEEDLAAVVPERDVTLLQNLDARLDIEAARRLLQEKLNEDD